MKKQFIILCLLAIIAGPSWAALYPDSVIEAGRQERRIENGFNFNVYGGLGVSRFEYKQLGDGFTPKHISNQLGFPSWNVGLGVNVFFVHWIGIGAGVEFNSYANTSAVTQGWRVTGVDYQGDNYILTSTPRSLQERENIYMLEVPLTLRFRAMPDKVGFTGNVGVKLGFPMLNSYALDRNGVLDNRVEYPHWSLTYEDIPNVIEDVVTTRQTGSIGPLKTLNYAAYVELGVLFQLTQRIDLAVSAFANYYINDVSDAGSRRNLSFADYFPTGKYEAPFTGSFNGILATNEVKELHPWSVGLKVDLQINAGRTRAQKDYDREQRARRRAERQQQEEPYVYIEDRPVEETVPVIEEPVIEEPDTTGQWAQHCEEVLAEIRRLAAECSFDLCSIFCEPVVETVQPEPAEQLDEMLSKAVIFFNLDDTVPILEPEDILIRIADVLRRHPDQQVAINGHACKLGTEKYNMRLAQRRAEAVANQLRNLGVRDEQMIVHSLGAKHPFHYHGTHTLSKDRRVEIVPIVPNDENATTETVIPGSRLAQIARRHYGEPEYWVFIYEANQDKLSSPNEVHVGVELVIPDLSKRLFGMNKAEAMQEAARLKEQLMK